MVTIRDKRLWLVVGIAVFCTAVLSVPLYLFANRDSSKPTVIAVAPLSVVSTTFKQPTELPDLTEEEFEELYGTEANTEVGRLYETYEEFQAVRSNSSFSSVAVTAEGINREIYDFVSAYFNVYYGYMRVSPIMLLAISNVETPGRADNSITWSAIFPSRYVPIEDLYTFDVTYVVSNPTYYKVFSTEYSTRDRGPLQMSPTYGTGDSNLNALMSGTEKEKLAQVDTSGYSTWVSGASSYPGDRFYIPDICLRMTAAFSGQITYMQNNNYLPTSDLQLVAMLAMSHQSSGIWTQKNHSKSVGCWKSGSAAFEFSQLVASTELVSALENLANTSDACYITADTATAIAKQVGISSFSSYATNSVVCTYPIKVLYSYIKLCMLYTS